VFLGKASVEKGWEAGRNLGTGGERVVGGAEMRGLRRDTGSSSHYLTASRDGFLAALHLSSLRAFFFHFHLAVYLLLY
jgi:hypothetical protein